LLSTDKYGSPKQQVRNHGTRRAVHIRLAWPMPDERVIVQQQLPWLFVEIACDLFECFAHSATSNVAWERYQSVMYKASEGVATFYNELMDASAELIH
jgi:hypothetical protein